jgi:hypothetical protein
MVDVKRILSSIDLLLISRNTLALGHALALRRWYAAPIVVLHVIDTPLALCPQAPRGMQPHSHSFSGVRSRMR